MHGELWAVHGGGFYHSQKFLTGAEGRAAGRGPALVEVGGLLDLAVGLGAARDHLLVGRESYLIDRSRAATSSAAGGDRDRSAASLVIGWLFYDALLRMDASATTMTLALIVFALLVAARLAATAHLFGGRAAYIHVGAMIGTIMVRERVLRDHPGAAKMVAEMRAGKRAGSACPASRQAAQRAQHLLHAAGAVHHDQQPLSDDLRRASTAGWCWAVFILAGALIRQFFVLRHQGKVVWALPVAGVLLLLGVAVALAPASKSTAAASAAVPYATVQQILDQRCVNCHAEKPTFEGQQPPAGVMPTRPSG